MTMKYRQVEKGVSVLVLCIKLPLPLLKLTQEMLFNEIDDVVVAAEACHRQRTVAVNHEIEILQRIRTSLEQQMHNICVALSNG